MSKTTTTVPRMLGTAGVINGKLQLSQGISRPISGGIGGKFTEIPIIDLTPMISPSTTASDKAHLISEIKDACTRVGFFIVKNHGVDWNIVENTFEGIKEFFDLPLEKKMAVSQDKSTSYQGYEPPYYTNVDRLAKGDLKESLTTGYDPLEDPNGVGEAMPKLLRRHNLWPKAEYCPLLKPALDAHRAALLNLSRRLAGLIAVSIGEKEDFFEKKSTYPIAGIRSLYYPPQEKEEEETTGLGAHTDVQLITLIAQKPHDIRALQVMNAAGEWITPDLPPQCFIVNLGDMMGRLTNDTLLSTVHRVCNKDTRGRYSLPFFFGLNADELTTTMERFVTPETPLREGYERGITGYEHYNNRLQRAHHKHPSAVNGVEAALPRGMTRVHGVLVEGI